MTFSQKKRAHTRCNQLDFFYLHSWLLDDCNHERRMGQLAWKEIWSCVLTQNQILRWKILQEGLGKVAEPLELCPVAEVP